MKALDLINPSIESTTAFVRALSPTDWLNLGIINFFSGSGSFGTGGGGPSYRSDFGTADFLKKNAVWIALLGGLGLVFAVALSMVSILFRFVLYDVVVSKKVEMDIWKRKDSAFQVLLCTALVIFAVLVAVVLFAGAAYVSANNPAFIIPAMLIGVPFFFCAVFAAALIGVLIDSFVMPDIFFRGVSLSESFRSMLGAVRNNLTESVVFVVAKSFIGAIAAALIFFIGLLALIPAGIVAIVAAGALATFAAYYPELSVPLAVFGSIGAVTVFLLVAFAISVATSPVSVLLADYTLRFYKAVISRSIE